MDTATFWKLIERSRRGSSDCEDQAERLTASLAKLEPAEIVAFDKQFRTCLNEAYRWDLWAVAYIVNGGCSDDGFDYFRCWLIGQGQAYFEAAIADAESAAKRIKPGDESECESLLYAAAQAYERATGEEEIPPYKFARRKKPLGKTWDEGKVHLLYPKLSERFEYSAD